jgi:hypothetical protein
MQTRGGVVLEGGVLTREWGRGLAHVLGGADDREDTAAGRDAMKVSRGPTQAQKNVMRPTESWERELAPDDATPPKDHGPTSIPPGISVKRLPEVLPRKSPER